jgi:hypothetical protein
LKTDSEGRDSGEVTVGKTHRPFQARRVNHHGTALPKQRSSN